MSDGPFPGVSWATVRRQVALDLNEYLEELGRDERFSEDDDRLTLQLIREYSDSMLRDDDIKTLQDKALVEFLDLRRVRLSTPSKSADVRDGEDDEEDATPKSDPDCSILREGFEDA